MSQDAKLLAQNAIYGTTFSSPTPTPTILNGGGGYPAINQDPDRPLANLLIRNRYRFWRTDANPPATLQVDYDFGFGVGVQARQVGVAMVRAYRGLGGFSELKVYADTAWPPTTLRATLAVNPATDNDVFLDLGSNVNVQFWRFEHNGIVGQFSCKHWLVRGIDVGTLTQGGAGAIETWRRVREKEREAFLGGKLFVDLGIGVAARIREFHVPFPALTTTVHLRNTQRGNFVYQHHDAKYYECRHGEPYVRWRRLLGSVTRFESGLNLVQVP